MKNLLQLFSLFVLLFCNALHAQVPAIEWQKALGGTNGDAAYSIQHTTDDGFIVAGFSASDDGDVSGNQGSYDYWVVKLDADDNIIWEKSLGGSFSEYALSVQQTTDGYIVAGYSQSTDGDVTGNHGISDYWIVKLDADGNLVWQKSFGGSGDDIAQSVAQTTDGGYIVTGWSSSNNGDVTGNHGSSDYWVVKLTSTGTITWQKSLGGSGDDRSSSVQQTADGGYIAAGWSNSTGGDVSGNHGNYDYWVVKLDATGTISWQKSLGGSSDDLATSVEQTTDGGYIVAGYSFSADGNVTVNNGNADYWIVKLDASGNLSWQKSLGGTDYDAAYSIQQTLDGGYIVAGSTESNDGDVSGNHGSIDDWLVQLDMDGNLVWQKCMGGTSDDAAFAVQQINAGEIVVAGTTESNDDDVLGNHGYFDSWVLKLGGCVQTTFYIDADNDGYGTTASTMVGCTAPAGYVADSTDCNDNNASINPGATEICNGIDDNCNGVTDEGVLLTFYADNDNDNYGNSDASVTGCSAPAGYVSDSTDCNDNNVLINPGETEICNAIDDNCNGSIDEGVLLTFYADMDNDSYGDAASSITACSAPAGYVSNNTDCNDNNPNIHPDAPEVCNGIDDNCINGIDDGLAFITYYQDADADTFGNHLVFLTTCDGAPIGYVTDSTDCDDTNPNVHPGAQEITNNGIDDNCNGVIDEFGVGIEQVQASASFTISPNPVSDLLTLHFELEPVDAIISIYDMAGKKITVPALFLGKQVQFNTTELASGFYTVQIIYRNTGKHEEGKFVKEE